MAPVKFYILPLLFIIAVSGCREDIIPPNDPVTNVNEIVQRRTSNSYTFLINAKNISFSVVDQPGLNSYKTRLSLSVAEYGSGEANITVLSTDLVLKESKLDNNVTGTYTDITGLNPDIIKIICRNFTGQLKVQLTRIN
jgi:hypothetical protein